MNTRPPAQCALLLALAMTGACVEDVWLGPERQTLVLSEAGTEDAGAPDAREREPAAEQDAGRDDDAAADGDAGELVTIPDFCGLQSCTIVGFGKELESCERGAPQACWPSPLGYCAVTCAPAVRCGRLEDAPCEPGTYCNLSNLDDACNSGSLGGYCTPYPASCVGQARFAVCGCDGRTYDSECEAARVGMSVATLEACESA